MSDLYEISLDRLLKDGPAAEYLDYLQESTDVVKSKRGFSQLLVAAVYLVIWSASMLVFWLFLEGSDAMGYAILFLYLLLPITTLILSAIIGCHPDWGRWRWLSLLAFGGMYLLASYGTFSMANNLAFGKINPLNPDPFLFGTITAALGYGLGAAINLLWRRNRG